MAGQMPGLQFLELLGGGTALSGGGTIFPCHDHLRAGPSPPIDPEHHDLGRRPDENRDRRVRPRPGGRSRGRDGRPDRRGSGNRQIHPPPAGPRPAREERHERSLCLRGGISPPDQAARQPNRRGGPEALCAGGKFPGKDPRGNQKTQAAGGGHRFHPDPLFPPAPVGARLHRPGPRIGRQTHGRIQIHRRLHLSHRPRDQGGRHCRPARFGTYRRHRSVLRRATVATPIGSCGR